MRGIEAREIEAGTYDTEARRFEMGSAALLDYIRRVQPRYHLFGHVHNAQTIGTGFEY